MLDHLLELFLRNWPTLLAVYAVGWIVSFKLRGRRWILPLWVFFVAPCLAVALWLAVQIALMSGLSRVGPEGGAVGMKMVYGMVLLGPFVAMLAAFAVAWPRRVAWGWKQFLAAAAASIVAWGGIVRFSNVELGGVTIELQMLDVSGRPLPGIELEHQGKWGIFAFHRGARLTSGAEGIVRIYVPPGQGVSGTVAPKTDRWQQVSVFPARQEAGKHDGTFQVARSWHSGVGTLDQSFAGDTWRPGDPPIPIYLPVAGIMATLPYCAAILLEAVQRTPAEVERIAAAATSLEGFRFLPLYGRWLSSRDAAELVAGWRGVECLARQLHSLRYATREIVLALRVAPERLPERERNALEGLSQWAGAGAAADPGARLAAVEDRLAQQETDIARLILPRTSTNVRRATLILDSVWKSTQPLVLEAFPRLLPNLRGQGRADFERFLRGSYALTPADAEPFLTSSDPGSVVAGCFLLRAVKFQLRGEAAARLERLCPLLTDTSAIAECDEALASLRK